MEKKIFIALFFVITLWFATLTFAETIVLKSGKKVEGKIIAKTDEYIKIDFQGVPLTYFFDEIESIDGEKVAAFQSFPEKEDAAKINQSSMMPPKEETISKVQQEVKPVIEKKESIWKNVFREKVNTVEKLAKVLKNEGINYQMVQESPNRTIKCPSTTREIKIDEEISLQGNDVLMVITRINNKESFESIKPILGVTLAMMEMQYSSSKGSVTANIKYPFLVTVVKEPAEGSVKMAMEKIFPGEEIEVITASEEGYRFVDNLKSQMKEMFK